ncbi:MAG: hypothetical protein IJU83_03575 [Clostridia bacterium]|nr:hypothetical protein [Clostridia bacterium]
MENQKRQGYFSVFFKQWHFVTALLLTAILFTGLLADLEYSFLANLYHSPKLFVTVGIVFGVALIVLAVTMFIESGRAKINAADLFGWAFVIAGAAYAILLAVFGKVSPARMGLAVVLFIYGAIVLIRSLRAYSKGENNDGIVEKSASGYYSILFKKYSFLAVIALSLFTVLAVYCFVNAPKVGLNTADVWRSNAYRVFAYIYIAIVVIYALSGMLDKTVRFFDVYVVSFLISAPIIAIEIAIMDLAAITKTRWFIIAAVMFVGALALSFIRFKRFDPAANGDVKLFKNNRSGYLAQISAKYTLLAPLAAAFSLFIVTLVVFRYTQFSSTYTKVLNGEIADDSFGTITYLIVSAASYFFLLFAGLISFASIKSKKVCIGDVMLLLCLCYTVIALISFVAMEPSRLGLWAMIIVLVYLAALLFVRIKTVKSAAKTIAENK